PGALARARTLSMAKRDEELARRTSPRRQAVRRNQAHVARLALRIARIAQAGGFEIGPGLLRAVLGERTRIGSIGFDTGQRSARFDLRRQTEGGDERGRYDRSGSDGVNGFEHDTRSPVWRPILRRVAA